MPGPIDTPIPVFGYYTVTEGDQTIITCNHQSFRYIVGPTEDANTLIAEWNLRDYKDIRRAEYVYAGIPIEALVVATWEGPEEYLKQIQAKRAEIKLKWPKPDPGADPFDISVTYDVKSGLVSQSLYVGPIKDALLANVAGFSPSIIGIYGIISDALNWGNFAAIFALVDGMLKSGQIKQEEYELFMGIFNQFNVKWESTGITNPTLDNPLLLSSSSSS